MSPTQIRIVEFIMSRRYWLEHEGVKWSVKIMQPGDRFQGGRLGASCVGFFDQERGVSKTMELEEFERLFLSDRGAEAGAESTDGAGKAVPQWGTDESFGQPTLGLRREETDRL